ncbi:MAG: CoA transferase [Alphaproteobacteria bacterium]|nr:MAG: CoA transferase [Alphaproteobacteria bacterium]
MSDAQPRSLPLEGVRVLDLGQVYQVPYATFLMAQAGAEVIKVEPLEGEPVRRRFNVSRGAGIPLALLNSGKKAITLNLKSDKGKQMLLDLVKHVDVVVENFRPGVMDRLGLGVDVLRAQNPRVIVGSASGYGQTGPDRDQPAMDITIQAASGLMSATGFPDGPPVKAGPAVADFLSGTHLFGAVTTALYRRERTGEGATIDIAMLETAIPALASNLGAYFGPNPPAVDRTGNHHGGYAVAPYNVYALKDGYLAIICINDGHWQRLCAAMGKPELADDPDYRDMATRAKNMARTDGVVEAWTNALTRDEALALGQEFGFPCSPVKTIGEMLQDPHLWERGMFHKQDHPDIGDITVLASPLRFDGEKGKDPGFFPGLGEHNDEVFGEWLNLSKDEIKALRDDGVI